MKILMWKRHADRVKKIRFQITHNKRRWPIQEKENTEHCGIVEVFEKEKRKKKKRVQHIMIETTRSHSVWAGQTKFRLINFIFFFFIGPLSDFILILISIDKIS